MITGVKNQNFSNMDPERQREIARMGGAASSTKFKAGEQRAVEFGRRGRQNCPTKFVKGGERASEFGSRGGLARAAKFKGRTP